MMLNTQILVRTLVLGVGAVALVACGQQGSLYLPPTGTSHRATLPESLLPTLGISTPPVQPAAAASTPQHP
ncbi:MAG: hypothetical protein GW907_05670 [Betaproteobacteria bacterium]|nr:hypothetical protein [Betaproteobacteria bacterium]NCP80815.1 hypothetical protein [Rhodoferax sp.]NCS60467.1 hypothetical protein [Rhodoferax sp.]PIZ22048.1 MAG: hypothetical protein COY49_10535 [Comamonadaceae bacterium CG_4_10_14_0_8_um_filter_57_29]PJC20087.1 MAG: hypothetical protein CO065_06195 [Comamonadaceae bacterium CG_4_9_14_0_8_um_filter_57_21]